MSVAIHGSNYPHTQVIVDTTGRLGSIEYAHTEVHEDELVSASHFTATVNIASPFVMHVRTPTATTVHSTFEFESSGPCLIRFFEGASCTGTGTALTHMRHYRPSTKSTTNTTFRAPAVSSTGTQLMVYRSPGNSAGGPVSKIGGAARVGSEIVLAADTSYIFTVIPEADNTSLNILHEYYMH